MHDQIDTFEDLQGLRPQQAMRIGNNAYGFHVAGNFSLLQTTLEEDLKDRKDCKDKTAVCGPCGPLFPLWPLEMPPAGGIDGGARPKL
jgi:hypothetical protein